MKLRSLLLTGLLAASAALGVSSAVEAQENSFVTVRAAASATATAAATSADQTNLGWKGVRVDFNVAVRNAPAVISCKIQGKNTLTGTYNDLKNAATGTLSATGHYMVTVYPGITTSGSDPVSTSDVLPRIWRTSCAVTSGGSVGFSAFANYQL